MWLNHTSHCQPTAGGSSWAPGYLLSPVPLAMPSFSLCSACGFLHVNFHLCPLLLNNSSGSAWDPNSQHLDSCSSLYCLSRLTKGGKGRESWLPPHPQLATVSIVWFPPPESTGAAGFPLEEEGLG